MGSPPWPMPGPAPRKRRHNEICLAYGTPWDELMPTELDLSTPQQADKPWLVGCFSCVNGDIQKVPAAEVLDSASAGEWPLLVGLILELPVLLFLR